MTLRRDKPAIVARLGRARCEQALYLEDLHYLSASSGSCRCSALASSHGARIHTSRSSSVVRIAGMAFGWIGSTTELP
jgi:hypothetical protein